MGCDWYDIEVHEAYGIVVPLDLINKVRKLTWVKCDDEEDRKKHYKVFDELLGKTLSDEDKAWIFEATGGFNVFIVFGCILMITPDSEIRFAESMSLPGPYEIDERIMQVNVTRGEARHLDIDENLIHVVKKLVPDIKDLPYGPGYATFGGTVSGEIFQIHRNRIGKSMILDHTDIPNDLTITVGFGNEMKSYKSNVALIGFYFPALRDLVSMDGTAGAVLRLPTVKSFGFEHVVDFFTLHNPSTDDEVPTCHQSNKENVSNALGILVPEKKQSSEGNEPAKKKRRPSEDDDDESFNVTFIVGKEESEIKARREILAASNPLLCRILYGVDRENANTPERIEWPDFDAAAVRTVFRALEYRNSTITSPYAMRRAIVSILDYIDETEEDLSLDYIELPWENSGNIKVIQDDKWDYFFRWVDDGHD